MFLTISLFPANIPVSDPFSVTAAKPFLDWTIFDSMHRQSMLRSKREMS
jgi:hypothetical protein